MSLEIPYLDNAGFVRLYAAGYSKVNELEPARYQQEVGRLQVRVNDPVLHKNRVFFFFK
jgi:hypothetical protein